MRIPGYMKEYQKVLLECMEQGREVPITVRHTYETEQFIDLTRRMLDEFVKNSAISKEGWKSIELISETIVPNDISDELKKMMFETVQGVGKLKEDLNRYSAEYFIDGYTLKKSGRKRIREAWNGMRK